MSENTTTVNTAKDYSPSWQRRFEMLDYLGADRLSYDAMRKTEKYKSLSFGERFRLSQNFLALFFGSIYYFCKGMWAKGLFIITASSIYSMLLIGIEVAVGRAFLASIVYWLPTAIFTFLLANYDYYRKEKLGEKIWPNIPAIFGDIKVALPVAFIALVANIYFAYQSTMMLADPYMGY
ncbi:DUF2628 domain-containing protein [Thalassospira marina]|uniref:DUF2628 domain-containing protein n=1 Tax=Thalassospira marina TaxID=2048283 RepID=A0ABN5FC99_9PROT|nr:DUF2628 domain-containing protein [Thalassospira marina]AUG52451.1 hypothetical protein CSC3H3_06780 [Thalassospira marina]